MQTIPRDADPVFAGIARTAIPRDAAPTFTAKPMPPILPNSPPVAVPQLVWLNDQTGAFTTTSETALHDVAQVLAIAGLLGELNGAGIQWTTQWTPATGSGGAPGTTQDGPRLIVWPQADTVPGVLSVRATVKGQTYGPITLTIQPVNAVLQPLTWSTGNADEALTVAGSANPLLAAVAGSWPPGTAFDWTISNAVVGLSERHSTNSLAVAAIAPEAGVLTASVTVTAPHCVPQALGPITLTVTN
jgi:hypothetical protein